jgi:type VI secretion system protein ImpJ
MADPKPSSRVRWYPVQWYEGMFLRPHHLQAADRHAHETLTASEDWYHPYNWGFRTVELDRDALRNRKVALHTCDARFEDGTKVTIPADGVPDPIALGDAMFERGEAVDVLLGVPRLREQEGRGNVEPGPAGDGARYWVQPRSIEDQNTGANEQEVRFRRLRCRLLLAGQPHDGYVTLPLARVILSETGAPMLDPSFAPPLLIMDAFPPLLKQVRALHHQISARIDSLIAQLGGMGRLYETQDTGEAERILKLTVLNGAFSHLESVAYTHGMTPLKVYQDLCRLAGLLAIFTPSRRPGNLPPYRHDDLGDCFAKVLYVIRLGLDAVVRSAYEVRYFEGRADGPPQQWAIDRLQVEFDPDWKAANRPLYLGVEGVESDLSSQECQEILRAIDMKLGGATTVEEDFRGRLQGLKLVPIAPDRPRVLPPGFVYYRIEGDAASWQDLAASRAMVLRFNPSQAVPEAGTGPEAARGPRVLKVSARDGDARRKVRFGLFVV